MRRIRLLIAYDGTGYNGWQIQSKGITIQGELEGAISKVLKERVRLTGSGRTDAGVHALGQVAHFDTSRDMPVSIMFKAFNANLPPSIVIREVEEVPPTFHARFSAKSRVYRYFISKVNLPFFNRYSWFVPSQLDLEAMEHAANIFVGEHDFACYGSPTTPSGSTVRRVIRCEVRKRRLRVEVVVEANAFLRKMVRNMVGALVKVGLGRLTAEEIRLSLDKGEPVRGGIRPAPAQGLFLWRVNY